MKILPDWTKAPDWAIAHALYTGGTSIVEVWVGECQYQTIIQGHPYSYGGDGGDSHHNPCRYQFHYETPRPEPWNGEGLPPVGCKLERLLDDEGRWGECECVAHKDGYAVIWVSHAHIWASKGSGMLRAIRTPEQIAAEQRDREIADLYFTINWNEGRDTWPIISSERKADYAKAIDAGYRKQATND